MRRGVLALLLVASPALLAAGQARGDVSAQAPIDQLYDAVLGAMQQAERLGYEGRAARLEPVISRVYDLPFMSEKVLGRHWKQLSERDRARWVETFSRLTVATYADRFDGYSGERFEVLGTEPASRETMLVRTRILRSDDEPVALDYRLHSRNGAWQIIDVYMNGTVSELALRRSEYSSLVKREGFESLVRSLQEKIENPDGVGSR